jgi:hypothetical protein
MIQWRTPAPGGGGIAPPIPVMPYLTVLRLKVGCNARGVGP